MKTLPILLVLAGMSGLLTSGLYAQEMKETLPNEKKAFPPELVKTLVDEGEDALKRGTFTIVNKPKLPASNDPHDYFTTATYWWPNPNTPDGLPYIRKDGQFNKENKSDVDQLHKLVRNVRKLAVAYHVTRDEKYALHAVYLLQVWFLNGKTRMNPHLRYAQAIPGVNDGRCIGIIDTWELIYLLDSVYLIQKSQAWTSTVQSGMVEWFSSFLDWLLKSDFGREYAAQKNNHGTWYLAQVSAYALFTHRTEEVKAILEKSIPVLIQSQIAEDGSQPMEINRTRSLTYSIFNLNAWLNVYLRCQKMGVPVLAPGSEHALRIKKAAQYLCDKAGPGKTWPHPAIDKASPEELGGVLARAGMYFHDEALVAAGRTFPQKKDSNSVFQELALKIQE